MLLSLGCELLSKIVFLQNLKTNLLLLRNQQGL